MDGRKRRGIFAAAPLPPLILAPRETLFLISVPPSLSLLPSCHNPARAAATGAKRGSRGWKKKTGGPAFLGRRRRRRLR